MLLPMGIAFTDGVAAHVRERLIRLRDVVGMAGAENAVTYFNLMPACEEPEFIAKMLDADGLMLLLDLHNLYTMALNHGFDCHEYLGRLPMQRVIEIHISGGSSGDPAWLPGGRALRLDSHAGEVPEAVWGLVGELLPRCNKLRGVSLERMQGTVRPDGVPLIGDELLRLGELLA